MSKDDSARENLIDSSRLTRRGVLQRAGMVVAAAALPSASAETTPAQRGGPPFKPPAGPDHPVSDGPPPAWQVSWHSVLTRAVCGHVAAR